MPLCAYADTNIIATFKDHFMLRLLTDKNGPAELSDAERPSSA